MKLSNKIKGYYSPLLFSPVFTDCSVTALIIGSPPTFLNVIIIITVFLHLETLNIHWADSVIGSEHLSIFYLVTMKTLLKIFENYITSREYYNVTLWLTPSTLFVPLLHEVRNRLFTLHCEYEFACYFCQLHHYILVLRHNFSTLFYYPSQSVYDYSFPKRSLYVILWAVLS